MGGRGREGEEGGLPTSPVWESVSEEGSDGDVMVEEGFLSGGQRMQASSLTSPCLSLSPLQLPRSLCCANLPTGGRRNARARASTLRTGGRGTEKAR